MKYFPPNPEIENTLKEIQRKIRLSMNGVVSDEMKKKGLAYKQNFGVNVPRLQVIASQYRQNADLARRLWALKIRETMILGIFLMPAEDFTEKTTQEWLQDINNIELTEQICRNLLSKADFAKELSLLCIYSENEWKNIAGFTLALRIREQFSTDEIEKILTRASALSVAENFFLYKSIANCLARFTRNGKSTANAVMNSVASFGKTKKPSQRYIYEEVMQEISFWGY